MYAEVGGGRGAGRVMEHKFEGKRGLGSMGGVVINRGKRGNGGGRKKDRGKRKGGRGGRQDRMREDSCRGRK